jgi:hypothetical protein
MTEAHPVTKEVDLFWKWITYNHWGVPVVPTGFILQRKVGDGDYVVVTYSIPPNPDPYDEDYTYTDTLPDDDAAAVFALGEQLTYRVRVYWLTSPPDSSSESSVT